MSEKIGEADENVAEHFERFLLAVELRDEGARIVFQKLHRVLGVDFHSFFQNVRI